MCKIALTLCIRDITNYPAYGIIFLLPTMNVYIFFVCVWDWFFRSRNHRTVFNLGYSTCRGAGGFFFGGCSSWGLNSGYQFLGHPKTQNCLANFWEMSWPYVWRARPVFQAKILLRTIFITFGPFLVCQECWKTMFPKTTNVPKENLQPDEKCPHNQPPIGDPQRYQSAIIPVIAVSHQVLSLQVSETLTSWLQSWLYHVVSSFFELLRRRYCFFFSLSLDFWCLLFYCFWLSSFVFFTCFFLCFPYLDALLFFSAFLFFFLRLLLLLLVLFFISLLIILMLPSSTPSPFSFSSPSSFCKFLFSSYVSFEELIVYHFLMFRFYYFLSTNSFSLFLSSGTWYGCNGFPREDSTKGSSRNGRGKCTQ